MNILKIGDFSILWAILAILVKLWLFLKGRKTIRLLECEQIIFESTWTGVTASEPHCKNLVFLRHLRELNDVSSSESAVSFSRQQLFQQSDSFFLNNTNVVGDFISGINSQFYNCKESFNEKKSKIHIQCVVID